LAIILFVIIEGNSACPIFQQLWLPFTFLLKKKKDYKLWFKATTKKY